MNYLVLRNNIPQGIIKSESKLSKFIYLVQGLDSKSNPSNLVRVKTSKSKKALEDNKHLPVLSSVIYNNTECFTFFNVKDNKIIK